MNSIQQKEISDLVIILFHSKMLKIAHN